MARLKAWCDDINEQQKAHFDFVFVPLAKFENLLDIYIKGHQTNKTKTLKVLA